MGYCKKFIPTKEAMKPFAELAKRYNPVFGGIEADKRALVHYVMKPDTNLPQGASNNVRNMEFQIRMQMDMLRDKIVEEVRVAAYKRWAPEEKELTFCGWEWAQEQNDDEDYSRNTYITKLLILTNLVRTGDYYDENDRFYAKYGEVENVVDDYEETVRRFATLEIFKELAEFEVPEKHDLQDGALKQEGE